MVANGSRLLSDNNPDARLILEARPSFLAPSHKRRFNEVEAALAAFVFAHVALRQIQTYCHIRLSHVLRTSRFLKEFAEDVVCLRVSGLGHPAMVSGLQRRTQNRILSRIQ